jgi:hypothetical protein
MSGVVIERIGFLRLSHFAPFFFAAFFAAPFGSRIRMSPG